MEHVEAIGLLGLRGAPTEEDVRAAFRHLIWQTHPDVTASAERAESGRQASALIVAYRVALEWARAAEPAGTPASPEPTAEPTGASGSSIAAGERAWLVDRDTIALRCFHEEAFARILDVGSLLGAITYLDRQGELLEVMLTTKLGDTVSLVISFQGRAEWVEAFLTTEVLDIARHELPTVDQITELVLHELLRRW
jgi:hypothetical protein